MIYLLSIIIIILTIHILSPPRCCERTIKSTPIFNYDEVREDILEQIIASQHDEKTPYIKKEDIIFNSEYPNNIQPKKIYLHDKDYNPEDYDWEDTPKKSGYITNKIYPDCGGCPKLPNKEDRIKFSKQISPPKAQPK
jgi:hypothetical protein